MNTQTMTDNVTPRQAVAVRGAASTLIRAAQRAESARRYASAEAYQSALSALVDAFGINEHADE